MGNQFFEKPILNSPYLYPTRHWELDSQGQPTQRIIESRRRAEFITPITKPKKRKGSRDQQQLIFDEGKGLSTDRQQYDPTSMINALRRHVDKWRGLPNPADWKVTPETALVIKRLLDGLNYIAEDYFKREENLNALLVIDEAHRLAPRDLPREDDAARGVRNILIDAARTTRKYGLGWLFISQTLSSLHTEILQQLRIFFFGFGLALGQEFMSLRFMPS